MQRKVSTIIYSLILFIGCNTTQPKPPPPQSTIDAIQKNLDIEGEDRWANWKVGYNKEEGNLYIQVAADPMANDIAMSGYIDLIKHIHKKHAQEYNLVGRVYQWGDLKKSCYVNGR